MNRPLTAKDCVIHFTKAEQRRWDKAQKKAFAPFLSRIRAIIKKHKAIP